MMNKLHRMILVAVAATTMMVFSASHADTDTHEEAEEERVTHYVTEKPASPEAAQSLFKTSMQKITTILEAETLNAQALEAIHEQSYALEASVDAFRTFKTYPEKTLGLMDEAVQAVHHASEDHEEEATRKWFSILETLLNH